MEIPFTWLGHLVRMLAVRCQDPVDNICFLSAEAVYNLYSVLLLQKRMLSPPRPSPPASPLGLAIPTPLFQNSEGLEVT